MDGPAQSETAVMDEQHDCRGVIRSGLSGTCVTYNALFERELK